MSLEESLELLKKYGEIPKEEYHSINSHLQKGNHGAPCGACGAC